MDAKHEETSRKMIAFRKEHGIKFEKMAARCGVSGALLGRIEANEWITHPIIAARICYEYELDLNDYNALVHADYRTNKLPKPKPKPGMKGWHDWSAVLDSMQMDDYNE